MGISDKDKYWPGSGVGVAPLSLLQLYRLHILGPHGHVVGPLIPLDAFPTEDQAKILDGIKDLMFSAVSIQGRSYVSRSDVVVYGHWVNSAINCNLEWREDTDAVVHHIGSLDWLPPGALSHRAWEQRKSDPDDLPGPIMPLGYFGTESKQVLTWCLSAGLIRGIERDGVTYSSYDDVFSAPLSQYFCDDWLCRGDFDPTYQRWQDGYLQVRQEYIKPRCYRKVIENDGPYLYLNRYYVNAEQGSEGGCRRVAFPRTVLEEAAAKFTSLYRDDETFLYSPPTGPNSMAVTRIGAFEEAEQSHIRRFIKDGVVRSFVSDGEELVCEIDLAHFEKFACQAILKKLEHFGHSEAIVANCYRGELMPGKLVHFGTLFHPENTIDISTF